LEGCERTDEKILDSLLKHCSKRFRGTSFSFN